MSGSDVRRERRGDLECQRSACELLAAVTGSAPDCVQWDPVHHLQGHAYSCGHEIVVIAARDDEHESVVVTMEDWEAIRLATHPAERTGILRERAIRSHQRFLELLAS